MWVDDISQALINLGGWGHYAQIKEEIQSIRQNNLSENWQAVLRRTIQQYSSDSQSYLGREDLFYSVDGIGKGVWGVRNYFTQSEISNDLVVSTNDEDIVQRHITKVQRIVRDTALALRLKDYHNNTCQICGLRLKIGFDKYYSEGHHIKGLGSPHHGPDIEENIIIVCPNCHVLCDNHQIELSLEVLNFTTRIVSPIFIEYHNRLYIEKNS